MTGRFDGKVVFITGGASGLGEATVRRFVDEGAKVVVADVDAVGAKRVADELQNCLALELDVRDEQAVEASFAEAETQFGGVDVVFDNAGIEGRQQMVHETAWDNWSAVRAVNGDGMFLVMKHGLAALLRRGGGSVTVTASAAGLAARPKLSAYTFAKAGIVGLVRSAAVEYGHLGIRVNAVAPTAILTPLLERFVEDSDDPAAVRAAITTKNVIPGAPQPSDVAAAVAFLSSDDAAWITGHTLPIDGGATIR